MVDHRGEIDKHPRLIASAIGIPIVDLLACIKDFLSPDPDSRSPENEGRRLELLDQERGWGWRVVNIQKYRNKAAGMRQITDGRNAQKVKKYRDKNKTPTDTDPHHATLDSYSDINKDKEKTEEAQAPVPGLNLESWNRFFGYRKSIGKPVKPVSVPAAQRELAGFGDLQPAVVEQSIANSWTGLFALKRKTLNGASSKWE